MRELEEKQAVPVETLDGICKQEAEESLNDASMTDAARTKSPISDIDAMVVEPDSSLAELASDAKQLELSRVNTDAKPDLALLNSSEAEKEEGLGDGLEGDAEEKDPHDVTDKSLTPSPPSVLDGAESDREKKSPSVLKNPTNLGIAGKISTKSASENKDLEDVEKVIDGYSLFSSDTEPGHTIVLPEVDLGADNTNAPALKDGFEDSAASAQISDEQELLSTPSKASERGALVRSHDKLELGSIFDKRYLIQDILGEGGFGVVYDALDLEDANRRVAIKTLRRTLADYELATKRFEREVFLSRSIESQHAVKIFASGVAEYETHYFVMEYIEGHALDLYLERHRKLSLFDTKAILLQVLDALSEAHDKDIIHRDLKPSNIIFSKRDDESDVFVKVLDFGIAKVISEASALADDEKLTQTGAWMGSPAYMSPEHLAGRSLKASSDIYAIGLIAIEMLTGCVAVEGDTPMEMAVSQMSQEEIDIEAWILETSLGPIISKSVKKDPKRRYDNAAELRQALLNVDDDCLKNEYVGVKMRRFTSERKVKVSATEVGPIKTPTGLNPSGFYGFSPEEQARRRTQILLIIGIVICLIVIVLFIVLKTYIDRSYAVESAKEEVVALKAYQAKVLQGIALGGLRAIDLPYAHVTIVSNPSDAKVIRASDGEVIGKSGDSFEVVRSMTTWDLIIRSEGYVDFNLPVVPIQRRENFTLTLLPMPRIEAIVGGIPSLPKMVAEPKQEKRVEQEGRAKPKTRPPSKPSKKDPKSHVGQWLIE